MDLLRSRSCSAKVFIMIGTGLKRIVDACKESSYRCEFEVQKSGFVVIFHRPENESRSDDPINDPINDPKTYLVSDPISQYGIQENEYNGPAEPVHRFMLSQAPNSTEPHTESA